MITKTNLIDFIDSALVYFASLSESQLNTLNLNLGLSSIGLTANDKPYRYYLDTLVDELISIREDYSTRPTNPHWNLVFILKPLTNAISIMREVIERLTSEEYEVVYQDTYQRLKDSMNPFSRLIGTYYFEPIYVSIIHGKEWTSELHGELEECPSTSSNAIVRLNQYFQLLELIQTRYQFILKTIEGDWDEISRVIQWNNQFEAFTNLDTELTRQLEILDKIYFGFEPDLEEIDFYTILSFFQDMFTEDFCYRFAAFFRDSEWIYLARETNGKEVIVDAIDLSKGLSEVRSHHNAYEDWMKEFWATHGDKLL